MNGKVARHIISLHAANRDAIRARLAEFRAVPPENYFYELCFCLLTPQSRAVHCDLVIGLLREAGFERREIDPEPFLHPSKSVYVRFHRTKAKRLLSLKRIFPSLLPELISERPSRALRESLVEKVSGLGYKEASHFLRNIGRMDLTIIDRHILRAFLELGLLSELPASIGRGRYLELEGMFDGLAARLRIPPDELDLALWSRQTGMILK